MQLYKGCNMSRFTIILTTFTLLILSVSIHAQLLIPDEKWEFVADGFDFPEGPAWHDSGVLYLSNCNGGWITRISDDKVDTLAFATDSTFKQTNGIIVSRSGDLFACEYGEGKIVKITPEGEVSTLIDGYEGKSFNRPNDITFDEKGNLYFSDPKEYEKEYPKGRVFYYDFHNKKLKLVADGLDFPNGLGISPVTKKLYLSESGKHRVLEFEIAETGELKNKQVFIELPDGDPDGIEFDVKGNLYVPHFGTGTVFVISQKGKILQEVKTPGKKPSNLEFGDSDLKTLYLTEDETNSVYKIRTTIAGYKLR